MAKAIVKRSNAGLAGIPAQDRKLVVVRHAIETVAGEKISLRQMYERIKTERQVDKEKLADKLAEQAKYVAKVNEDDAKDSIREALSSFADVRDMAHAMERNNAFASYMDARAYGKLMRLALEDAGRELEQALDTVDVVKLGEVPFFIDKTAQPKP